jgi:hypothetical protein
MQMQFQTALRDLTTLSGQLIVAQVAIGWPSEKTLSSLTQQPLSSGVNVLGALYDRRTSKDVTRWAPNGVKAQLSEPGVTVAWENPLPVGGFFSPQQASKQHVLYTPGQSTSTVIPLGQSTTLSLGGAAINGDGIGLVFLVDMLTTEAAVAVAGPGPSSNASLAAALVNQVNNSPELSQLVEASATGSTVTLTNIGSQGFTVQANVGNVASRLFEVGRRRRELQFVIWAPSEDIRGAAAGAIDSKVAALESLEWPIANDGTFLRVEHLSDYYMEDAVTADLYRYDTIFCVEHSVTIQDVLYPILAQTYSLSPSGVMAH